MYGNKPLMTKVLQAMEKIGESQKLVLAPNEVDSKLPDHVSQDQAD
jgi:hypothetical protein